MWMVKWLMSNPHSEPTLNHYLGYPLGLLTKKFNPIFSLDPACFQRYFTPSCGLVAFTKKLASLLVTYFNEQHYIGIPCLSLKDVMGAQWLSGRVLDSRQSGLGFEPHRRQCVVVFEQDTSILA